MRVGGRSSVGRRLAGLCAGAALGVLALAPLARADEVVCQEGGAPGQCTNPTAVAVDRGEGIVYVADSGNQEVDAYKAEDGSFLDSLDVGVALSGIAVDNDTTTPSPAAHDVYAFDSTNKRVLKLHPTGGGSLEFVKAFGEGSFAERPRLALGVEGTVYVADNTSLGGNEFEKRILSFDHTGEFIEEIEIPTEGKKGFIVGFAVDFAGIFYVATNFGDGAVRKYDSAGSCLNCAEAPIFHNSFNIQTIAVDGEDNLFVGDSTGVSSGETGVSSGETSIYAYDPAADLFKVLYGSEPNRLERRPVSLAPLSSEGEDLFAVEGLDKKRVLRVSYPEPGPLVHPNPALSKADPIGNTWATLNARINPEGKASEYRFQYVDDAAWQAEGFSNPEETAEQAVPLESVPPFVDPSFGLAAVSAQIGCTEPEDPPQASCLAPETLYHFRAVAESPDGEDIGPEATFETKEPFEILATFATQVGFDAAKVNAEVNPLNIPATGHFEYVTQESFDDTGFEAAAQTEELDFGASEEPIIRGAQLHGLQPGTTYRYRVVVENSFGKEEGEAHAFTTFALPGAPPFCPNERFRFEVAAGLPDCRAYEMVSPPDKGGGEVAYPTAPLSAIEGLQAAGAPGGRGLAYTSETPFGDAVSAPFVSQYLASRRPGEGWRTHAVSPPREGPSFLGTAVATSQYKAFSEDLRWGWLRSDSEPLLDPGALPGYANLHRRDNTADSYEPLCSPSEAPELKPVAYLPELQGFTPAGAVAAFRANEGLSPEAAPGNAYQLYGCLVEGGEPELLSVLPPSLGGKANPDHSSLGTPERGIDNSADHNLHNAVSADGSRAYWTDLGSANTGTGKIYLRENPFAAGAECGGPEAPCTVAVSAAVGGAGSEEKARFWTASPDGSTAIFQFAEGPLAGNLYEFDAASATPGLIATGVSGVAGWSEDASRLYLVSDADLDAAGPAEAGTENLYLREAGEMPRLVRALPSGGEVGGYCNIGDRVPRFRCARATPAGSVLAFVSQDPLTEYDNADAVSGEPDAEIYLFDADAPAGEDLLCVSCNPSGARPAGREVETPGSTDWIAARIPGWNSGFHAPRVLSSDGRRLFFESFDALVPADTNGAQDVYQWERAGKGGCAETASNYFPSNGGCLDLISSGQSPKDSHFADASANGADVFFATDAGLLPQDPGLVDFYDARIGGGFPLPPPPSPECEGEACQSPPTPPRAPAPASGAFLGPGNLADPVPSCKARARRAKRFANKAKRARRAARRSQGNRARGMRRRAKGAARSARRLSRQAKRCRRARARQGGGGVR
jgi:hypothetical protein